MSLDPRACYRVLLARDARYDGRFFTCVKTTGIYCRPICPARTPKLANCVFVPSAAAAQEAGFRPCLRCRPERSPYLLARLGRSATVVRALALIDRGALDDGDIEALAARLGVGARQLRRLFHAHLGASPISVAQTRRVLLAKQLIHDSTLSMTQVALASGFSSVRRFNETFKMLYGRPPSALRRRTHALTRSSQLTIYLPYQPPYDFAGLLAFLRARAIAGVEHVTDQRYARVVEINGVLGTLSVRDCPGRHALRVVLPLLALTTLPTLIARVRHVFDLGCDPSMIARDLARDALLAPLVKARPGLRLPGAWDGFELAVRGVLGQQITVQAATRLASQLVACAGRPLPRELTEPGLTHAFPAPSRFTHAALERLGIPRARIATLIAVARAAQKEPDLFAGGGDLEHAVARLLQIPGIGPWTAHYIAMRALGESDAFPVGDIGVLRAVAQGGLRPSHKALSTRAEAWRPWRAYATLHLWTHDAAQRADPPRRVSGVRDRKEPRNALAS